MRFSPKRLPVLSSDLPLSSESQNFTLAKSFTHAVAFRVVGTHIKLLNVRYSTFKSQHWRSGDRDSLKLEDQPF